MFVASHALNTIHADMRKGDDGTYVGLFTAVKALATDPVVTTTVRHFPNGRGLRIECRSFIPCHPRQIQVLHQDGYGWHTTDTTAFYLANADVDMGSYVQGNMRSVIATAAEGPLGVFFQLAWQFREVGAAVSFLAVADTTSREPCICASSCTRPYN